jgi:hypothetical protein
MMNYLPWIVERPGRRPVVGEGMEERGSGGAISGEIHTALAGFVRYASGVRSC